jgi:peptidoglycan/LPS O-acetylase OafA/YrhL
MPASELAGAVAEDVAMEGPRRDRWLDALRGVAVLLVLGRHLELPADAHPLLACWQRGGWVGVDLFFVLSGFLVSGLLFREYRRSGSLLLWRFLVRRAFRIYPAFFVLLGCTWLVSQVLHTPRVSGRAFLVEMLFVQNYFRGVWNHTWSLAVEEHFYIGLPLLLLGLAWMGRRTSDPFRSLVPLGAVTVVVLAGLRCLNSWRQPYSNPTHLFPTHLRADSLLAGVLLAYAWHFHRTAFDQFVGRRRRLLLCAGMACFVPAFMFDLETAWLVSTVGLSLFALGAVLVIAAGLGGDAPSLARWLAPVGGCSYSIYLWHVPVLIWGVPLAEHAVGYRLDNGVRMLVYLAGSLMVGAGMAWLIEKPALRLRDAWIPSTSERRTIGKSSEEPARLRQCA